MEDFKQRLIIEQEELEKKLNRLLSFLDSDKFKTIEPRQQILLIEQSTVMTKYNDILKERLYQLTNFKKEEVLDFLKKCSFGFENGKVYFSTTMDKFTLFFNENGIDFFELWNKYTPEEQDNLLKECFIVK